MTARVASVNVGRPRPVDTGRRVVETAIWKQPVAVRGVNVDGDDQADRTVHGGPDKAVYAYALEEIRQWEDELGRPLGAAAFGENLTTEGIDVSGALVGERWRIGTTLLEVVQPAFVRRFALASRPGAYLRIIEEGELGAGDAIEVDLAALPDHGVSMRLLSDAILLDDTLIPQALAAPQLIPSLRDWLAGRAA